MLGADKASGRGTSLAAGKYLTDDIYVEIVTDARGFTATQLTIALTRTLSVLAGVVRRVERAAALPARLLRDFPATYISVRGPIPRGSTAMTEHFDVIVVGAGLSGIGAAWHLQERCPDRSYAILEGAGRDGGTWDLFRYPGIRSDSDMHTLGYAFRPWTQAKAMADGPSIRSYVEDTAREAGIDRHIRFGHKVVDADWSTADARWTVTVERDGGERATLTCAFLYMCSGYYRYDRGHARLSGARSSAGASSIRNSGPPTSITAGKRVVVIGSGATAVTLVPEMAREAAQVTMLQRSPTYVVTRPAQDRVANWLRAKLPAKTAYGVTRWKNVLFGMFFYRMARKKPERVKQRIVGMVREHLGQEYDVATRFTPSYNPWDQRLCLVPDADLFGAIKIFRPGPRWCIQRMEAVHAGGHPARIGARPAGRRDRHGDRAGAFDDGGRQAQRGRRSGERRRAAAIQEGHDAVRRAQHGVHLRLHQRLLDAEGRSRGGVCLSLAQHDEAPWPRAGDAADRGGGGIAGAVRRLYLRLYPARVGAPAQTR
ncbi:NAD(P)-binding protein [Sphingomonas sp. MMS24-JH45]